MKRFIQIIHPEEQFIIRVPGYDGTEFFARRITKAEEDKIRAEHAAPKGADEARIRKADQETSKAILSAIITGWNEGGITNPVTNEPVAYDPAMLVRLPNWVQNYLYKRVQSAGAAEDDPEAVAAELGN